MRLTSIALVLCACVCLSAGDVVHLKTAKAKLIGRFLKGKPHKRGVLSSVPAYKQGYDIPVVTHSVVKPFVVSYPPAAAITNVKVPLAHPLATRYPVPVGHKFPVPQSYFGLKYPHQTKTVKYSNPDHHFHHHHHHVAPKPGIPVVPAVPATPVIPVGEPTATVAHPVPAPPPPVLLQPAPIPAPAPIFPAASLAHTQLIPQENTHLRPVVHGAPTHSLIPPLLQYANQFQYVLRPGNAVQTSFFANYPRYPFLNYQTPVFPLPQASPTVSQSLYERPQAPHFHVGPQSGPEVGLFEQTGAHVEPPFVHAYGGIPQHAVHLQPTPQPGFHLQPTQPGIHLQPTQPGLHLQPVQPGVQLLPDLHHPGQREVHLHSTQPEVHLQPGQLEYHLRPGQQEVHFHQSQPEFHLQPGQPEYHLQPGQQEVHLHQGQQEVHLHQGQPDVNFHQAQPEVYLHGVQPGVLQAAQPGVLPTQATEHLQPTQPTLDQDGWHPVQTQPHELGATQPGDHFSEDGQFAQGALFGQDGKFSQGGYYVQDGQLAQGAHFGQDGQLAQGAHFGQDGQLAQGAHFGQDGQLAQGAHFGQDGQLAQGAHFGQDGQLAQGAHFGQDGQLAQGAHFGQDGQLEQKGYHQFTQEQGTQVYEQHTGEQQYHGTQNQLQHHIQQQLEQAKYDLHVNNHQQQQHQQPDQEYGGPQFLQDGFSQSHNDGQDFSQPGQNFGQQGHDYNQQGQNFGQDFSQTGQNFGQDFSQQQPAAEYGGPQGAEGRSSAEAEEEPQFRNHIPLMLQPPLERPLEHFR